MKLDCVLTAVNENKLYIDFIPIFIKTWNKLYPEVDIKIILVAKTIPENLLVYKKNIIIFKPPDNILTSFIAQFIRLLYPCILTYENGVLITDIDLLPMNNTYFTENIKELDNDKFIYYRDKICFNMKQIAICYNVATPRIWKDIFKINSVCDIEKCLKETFSKNVIKKGKGNIGWYIDQITLYNKIENWEKKCSNFVSISEKKTKFNRLNRKQFKLNKQIKEKIISGEYIDYHCYRPMSTYFNFNWEIYNLLPSSK